MDEYGYGQKWNEDKDYWRCHVLSYEKSMFCLYHCTCFQLLKTEKVIQTMRKFNLAFWKYIVKQTSDVQSAATELAPTKRVSKIDG